MQTRLKKTDLLNILTDNRANHRLIFEEAVEGYRKEGIRILNEKMDSIKAGKLLPMYWSLVLPQDHTKAYDRAIRMVEMHEEETIVLNEQDFANFVQDEWGWRKQFLTANSTYSKRASDTLATLNDAEEG